MIKLSQVSKRYPNGYDAINNISFEVDAGDMLFITGHSGAGKSTLFKLISRIEKPTGGQIWVQGSNINRLRESQLHKLRREIGVVFQDHKLIMSKTVFDNVALPLVVIGMPSDEIRKRVRAALGKVGLEGRDQAMPETLSGGEQQRVGIARAVINRPSILLADEPTGNLDDDLSDEIIDIFADFNRVGVTVLIATHDLRQIDRLGCASLELQAGSIAAYHGAPGFELTQEPRERLE